MHVITNMQFVKSSGSSCRSPYDGVLTKNGWYLISFCHGTETGELVLQIKDELITTFPNKMRYHIKKFLGYRIKKYQKIFISPCFPKQVKEKYGSELKNNLIFLATGNWNCKTGTSFYDGYDIPYTNDLKRKTDYPISQFIGDWDFMEKEGVLDDKEYHMKFYKLYLNK
jgi:hypothetical protein